MSGNPNARRLAAPKGTMTRGANSGPAIMLLPPVLRACFMPGPPLGPERALHRRRRQAWTGVASYLARAEAGPPPPRTLQPTPRSLKEERRQQKRERHERELAPAIEAYRAKQKECGGEYRGMNCYNTLFVGRLAYEVTERKLLREFEHFGSIKDLRVVSVAGAVGGGDGRDAGRSGAHPPPKQLQQQRSKYAFVEYEHEEDMKRAYRAADGMKLEGRDIVVDVERGHTVPTWLPRRLGGGLGGTRLGGKGVNVTRPGRYDPSRPDAGSGSAASTVAVAGEVGRGGSGVSNGAYPPPHPPPYSYHAPPPHAPPPPPVPASYGYSPYAPQPGPSPSYGRHGGRERDDRGRDWDDRGGGRDRGDDRGGGGGRDGGRSGTGKRPRSNSPDRRHHHGSSSSSSHRHRSSRY